MSVKVLNYSNTHLPLLSKIFDGCEIRTIGLINEAPSARSWQHWSCSIFIRDRLWLGHVRHSQLELYKIELGPSVTLLLDSRFGDIFFILLR